MAKKQKKEKRVKAIRIVLDLLGVIFMFSGLWIAFGYEALSLNSNLGIVAFGIGMGSFIIANALREEYYNNDTY